ncbi:asparagine synthase (glutamine-hydrolyzing) [Mucilaginibacter corticis]|uniref:asparagine synthase (glutamine-hydrolyzing) n=1 Tax=Mucilaginibacter corticis TaxID=2597670 RepID=A0A556MM37_9SPHI|nr:asparagine synthase (glutamine-hydrolyzing) [Mucilaginibacter corticis]TSJ40986.1 asparagine synthase (glutamine-hydrolyzing) [Mucilaginibacter corticis]
MCGIAGYFHFDRARSADQTRLKRMTDVIAHRGPDGEGFYTKANVGLGHRRLSIIDLSLGAQPMYSDDKKLVIVFNGEIYNYLEIQEELKSLGHRFKTNSDTEVIIRAYEQWGTDCQHKFNGMWAFALWDDRQQHLFVTRDCLGEKPLNYGVFDGTFVFGSEIKSIGAYGVSLKPDEELLELFLFLGYIPEPYTFYKGIKKLEAGHYLIVKGDDIQKFKHWDLPETDEEALLRNEGEVVEEFQALFSDSVRIRMRSDVPFGAFLSGGLDSSSIVSVMSEFSRHPVETFTIGFDEKKFDERGMAGIVADRFNTNHHEHVVTAATFDESLKRVLFHYDEPYADPAAIPTGIVSGYAAEKVKMVLTGDGADEVLAGYTTYQSENIAGRYQQLPGLIRQGLPKISAGLAPLLKGGLRYRANRLTRVLHNFNAPFQERLISKSIKIPVTDLKSVSSGKHLSIEDFVADVFKPVKFRDPFYLLTYYNLKVSLPAQMLVKVDKMSMAHSLETRAPFLDRRIVEYLYRVDKNVKLPNGNAVKNVLKKSMTGKLPPEIIDRRKKGFDVPLREWFKGDSFDRRLSQDFDQFGLNGKLIGEIFGQNKYGKADHGALIWRLLVYTGWMRQF